MTVPTTTSAVSYAATGTDDAYVYTWQIADDTDLVVFTQNLSGDVTQLDYPGDFTVTGANVPTGGTVVLTAGDLAAGYQIFIASDPSQVQQLLLQQGAAQSPAAIMAALDLLTREVQATRRIADNSLQLPLTESLEGLNSTLPTREQRAGLFPTWDVSGNLILTDTAPATTQAVSVLNNAALKALTAPAANTVYATTGYATSNDGGGGLWYWNAASTTADNAGIVLQLNAGGTGRFFRLFTGDYNVQWFGAVGDGSTNDTVAIQATVTAAEAAYANWGPPTSSPSIGVFLPVTPAGLYRINGTITITKPINFYGAGYEVVALLQASTTAHAIEIAVSQSLTYKWPVIRDFSIYSAVSGTTTQHGVVLTSPAATDAMVRVQRLNIIALGGDGYHAAENGNSCFITECRIMLCRYGIFLGGTFQTDQFIDHNLIRQNQVGIEISPDMGEYITTVRITNNLFESNTEGTGTLGDTGRPSCGIRAVRAQTLVIERNYFENHADDIYFSSDVSFCLIKDNWMYSGNANNLPNTYGGPPARKLGALLIEGSNNVSNIIRDNYIAAYPLQPGGTSNADWNTATWGASYEVITDTVGINRYYDNITNVPTTGDVTITNTNNRHTIRSVIADPSGSERGIVTELMWQQKNTYGNASFREERTAQQRRTFVNSFPMVDGYDFQTDSPAALVNINVKNGSAVDTTVMGLSPFGQILQTWVPTTGTAAIAWSYGSAAPVAGAHLLGEIVFDQSPSSGGKIGWVCTTAGTPGTWKTWGSIS